MTVFYNHQGYEILEELGVIKFNWSEASSPHHSSKLVENVHQQEVQVASSPAPNKAAT